MAAPNCRHRTVRNVVSIGCSAITFPPFFFFFHNVAQKAVRRCPTIEGSAKKPGLKTQIIPSNNPGFLAEPISNDEREMLRQWRSIGAVLLSSSASSSRVEALEPESHDPPPLFRVG
jgi:hypothetical protein